MKEADEIDDWEVVLDHLKGVSLGVDRTDGKIVYMSTRQCSAADLWNKMPSVAEFTSLAVIDLHKCRYIDHLNESVCDLTNLRRLLLTRCSKLSSLPNGIGRLQNLTEVRTAAVGKVVEFWLLKLCL